MKYNPAIERQLDAIAQLCSEAIDGAFGPLDAEQFVDRSSRLLKALLLSGFGRSAGAPLQVELEQRIIQQSQKAGMHRRGALSGLTKRLQKQFNELARWESTQPATEDPPQAANVRSAATSTRRRQRD